MATVLVHGDAPFAAMFGWRYKAVNGARADIGRHLEHGWCLHWRVGKLLSQGLNSTCKILIDLHKQHVRTRTNGEVSRLQTYFCTESRAIFLFTFEEFLRLHGTTACSVKMSGVSKNILSSETDPKNFGNTTRLGYLPDYSKTNTHVREDKTTPHHPVIHTYFEFCIFAPTYCMKQLWRSGSGS